MQEEQTAEVEVKPQEGLVKKLSLPSSFRTIVLPALVIVAVILAGALSGSFLAGKGGKAPREKAAAPGAQVTEKEVGIEDPETFRDTAEGVLEEGGIDGEGTHHLVREGGPSQNVYLTSSIVDLDGFVGRKVQVWGETFAGQKAGWLMDVGRLKVLD